MLSQEQLETIRSNVSEKILKTFDNQENQMVKTIVSTAVDAAILALKEYDEIKEKHLS